LLRLCCVAREETKMSQEKTNPFVLGAKDIAAGSLAGIAQCLSGHPLDTVKVRLQTQPTDVPLKYKNMMDCFSVTIKEEGFLGLYKGVQSPLVGMALMNSVLFLSYGQAKRFAQKDENDPLSLSQLFTCGAFVGLSVAFVEGPVDFLKSQLQVDYGTAANRKYNGFIDCAKKIVSRHGFLGLYQGFGATLLRDIPANAAYFGFYEFFRRSMVNPGQTVGELPVHKVLISGGLAGMLYWISTYPVDVVKSSIQADKTSKSERKYKGTMDAFSQIYKSQGFKGFWKGFTPCMVRAFPANAVCFLAYEQTRKFIG